MFEKTHFYKILLFFLLFNLINNIFGKSYIILWSHVLKGYLYTFFFILISLLSFFIVKYLPGKRTILAFIFFAFSFLILFFDFIYRLHVLKNPKHSIYSIYGLLAVILSLFASIIISFLIHEASDSRYAVHIICLIFILPLLMHPFRSYSLLNEKITDDRPNIVLISMDTYRHDVLGIYKNNSDCGLTRYIQKHNSTVFLNHYTCSPQTNPSHSTMFTSLYLTEHGVYTNAYPLSAEFDTLAEVLKDSGYNTFGYISGLTMNSSISNLDQGFLLYNELYSLSDYGFHPLRLFSFCRHFAKRKAQDTNRAIKSNLPLLKRGSFFLFVHFFDPHAPYEPENFKKKPYYSNPDDREAMLKLFQDPQKGDYLKGWVPRGAGIEYVKELYYKETEYLHSHLVDLLSELEADDLLSNAIIIITADHGESLDEHSIYFDHVESPYNTTIKVPMIIINDSTGHSGLEFVDKTTSHLDIMPTILNFCNITPGNTVFHGKSLISSEDLPDDREHVFHLFGKRNITSMKIGIIDKDLKIITDSRNIEIYDLLSDPMEKANLYMPAENMDPFDTLLDKAADAYIKAENAVLHQDTDIELNPKLKSLGYIQ